MGNTGLDKAKQAAERQKFQDKCVSLSQEYKHLLITAATGCGKGLAVAKAMKASLSPKSWLVVVPEILQVENYKEDLVKHGHGWMLRPNSDGVKPLIEDVICYASLKKYEGRELNLACNEVHRLSDMRWDIAKTIKFDQIISDSATVPSGVKEKLMDLCPFFEFKITLNEAIDRGILPEPRIYCIGVELDDLEPRNHYKIKSRVFTVTDKEYSKYLDKQIIYWVERGKDKPLTVWQERILFSLTTTRKNFLAECKTGIVQQWLKIHEDKRKIVFCGSINQSIELGGKYAVHSKRSPVTNKKVLAGFNLFEFDSIFMNRMGREGLNLEALEVLYIVQLDSGYVSDLAFIQMTGRGMRADAPEIFIFYCKGTQDHIYLDRALKNINSKYITRL